MVELLPRSFKKLAKRTMLSALGMPLRARYQGSATILCYHRITKDRFHPEELNPTIWLQVDREDFAYQLRTLRNYRECLSLDQALMRLEHGTGHKSITAVTFDDGYKDNLTLALPLLERFGIPATIFITSGFINRTAALWWEEHKFIVERVTHLSFIFRGKPISLNLDTIENKGAACYQLRSIFKDCSLEEQADLLKQLRSQCPERYSYDDLMLNWNEVVELSKHPLITIGSHTENHPVLSKLSEEQATQEIKLCQNELEDRLKKKIDLFAYPIGGPEEAGPREFEIARKLGLRSAVTTRISHWQPRHKDHLWTLPRITIDYFDSDESFAWKLSGLHAMVANGGKRFITE